MPASLRSRLAELLIGHLPLQHLVADHQDRVSHRHGCFLGITPPSEVSVVFWTTYWSCNDFFNTLVNSLKFA
jgi:hypothetical protein